MKAFAVSAMMIAAWFLPSAPASAWDDQGHELIGAIADTMLGNSKAGVQARQILGYDLASAAKWAASSGRMVAFATVASGMAPP